MYKQKIFPLLILLSLQVLMSGCGGGDSSDELDSDIINNDNNIEPGDTTNLEEAAQPNILLIISDDQGLDASAQYAYSEDLPLTPTLDELATQGIVFDNAWATPACTTTRSTIITGKFGVNSGVTYVPAILSSEHETIQSYLKRHVDTQAYQSAVFGKWHLSGGNGNNSHPSEVGIEHYAGNIHNMDDYFDWPLTINGEESTSNTYHTTKITDLALTWINEQVLADKPWFTWLAYSAPHSPFHLPPLGLLSENSPSRGLLGTTEDINTNKRAYYLAAIEAMDSEIGRLLNSLDAKTRANTVVIFIGDNGTPKSVIDQNVYASQHGKGTLFQGSLAVPLLISGKGVTRENDRESALITATDLYATVAEIAGIENAVINDSHSFKELLSNEAGSKKTYVYTEFESDDVTGWTVRNENYKYIQMENGSESLFDISDDFSESHDLLPTSDVLWLEVANELKGYGENIVGTDTNAAINITNAPLILPTSDADVNGNGGVNCAAYVENYYSDVLDVGNSTMFIGDLSISVLASQCLFSTNAIPNHDFNDGDNAFPNHVSEQSDEFYVSTTPSFVAQTTALSLQVDNAILLNGVKVDLLAAGCYGIGNGKIGCNDDSTPWRYDPMHEANGFNVDSHHAHAQPDGTYHYHGSPLALFPDDNSTISPVVGFAADGFPIYGSFINDNGDIRKAIPSYQLKAGTRPTDNNQPGGTYDGTYRDDYEYKQGTGDLDECNGMTVNDTYGYYITDNFPYVLACFKGTPNSSFNKR